MVSIDLTLYSVLGVSRHATDAQIRAAYRLRALATHPDKGGNEEEFLKVVEAFEILADLRKRQKYDEDLQRTGSQDGRHQEDLAAEAAADTFGLPDLGQTEPNQQPVEGWNSTEETQRAKALWLELLEKPLPERKEHLRTLSCRTAEVLLTFAKAQFRGAPVVAGPGAPQDCGNALLAASPEVPEAKRAKLDGPRGCFARGSRAHVCLQRLKVCTGASEDLSEAINWHILLVRVKQLFDEQMACGSTFPAAVRHSVQTALAEASGSGGHSDPRLRFVTECNVESEVLFTPVSWDLEVALRQNQELCALLDQGAERSRLLETIGHMVAASQAAEVEQKTLIDELEQHIFTFRKLLRWRSGLRPAGVNASLSQVVGPSFWGDKGAPPSTVSALAYAELWHQKAAGLEPLCRGPRRKRQDEALKDLEALQAAQSKGGDAAARAEAKRLYEDSLRASMLKL